MLQITPHMRLLLAVDPADFRCGIDGLMSLCRQRLDEDPFTGAVFVFTNRRKTSVKLLVYDGNGFWLCTKRFSQGRLAWWPRDGGCINTVTTTELQLLLQQSNPRQATLPEEWRKIPKTVNFGTSQGSN